MRAARALYVAEQRGAGGGFNLGAFLGYDQAEVWPENWPAFSLFSRVQTQWRTGPGGPIGLDYGAIYPLLDRLHPDAPAEWDAAMADIQTMEAEALDEMRSRLQ